MRIAERIAGLPEAVNTAIPFTGKLTQRDCSSQTGALENQKANAANRSHSSTTEASRLTKSLFAVDDSDYTKADAVNKQWRKMSSVNLFDLLDGTADTSNRNLSMGEVEQRLQQGGLLDEVSDMDLRMLEFEFSGIGFQSKTAYPSVDSGTFDRNVDYIASRYAAMEDKIRNTYTGAEQKERLEKLDALYDKTLERTAKEYADIVGGILEEYGVSGEKEKIYRSFKNGVNEKALQYRDFLQEHRGVTGLEGTEDAWLLKDDEYIAARLRGAEISSGSLDLTCGDYSLRELDALGQYASGLSSMMVKANTYEMNEERMGLELAVLAMKTDALSKEKSTGAMLKATLQEVLNRYSKCFMEQMNHQLEENRNQARTPYDGRGNAGLNQTAVWSVYNKTMAQYHSSGDAMKALIQGAEYGKAQYDAKMRSGLVNGIYRYENSRAYWNDFFENAAETESDAYHKTGSTYEQYMAGWLDFQDSLNGGKSIRMNTTLRPARSYSIEQAGNWLDANA